MRESLDLLSLIALPVWFLGNSMFPFASSRFDKSTRVSRRFSAVKMNYFRVDQRFERKKGKHMHQRSMLLNIVLVRELLENTFFIG
jgi:hypothetical protein